MGKNGLLLRQAKQKSVTYTFTKEQLQAHDQKVREVFFKSLEDRINKQNKQYEADVWARVNEEWDRRNALFSGNDVMAKAVSLVMAIVPMILVDNFGWKALPEDGRWQSKCKLYRFANLFQDEINRISGNELLDIRKIADASYKKTGVRFMAIEDDADES